MGGVPALLMMAALGVTYGWQPDNKGGVEYLIQIPPDQLEEIERLGAITSTIDPAVRGRVSKVIITVGNGPLPRTAPPIVAGVASGNTVAQADLAAMPIPEQRGAANQREMAMKPQGPTAPGFGLPPSLAPPGGQTGFGSPPGVGQTGANPAGSTPRGTMSPSLSAQLQNDLRANAERTGAAASGAVTAGAAAAGTAARDAFNGSLGFPPTTAVPQQKQAPSNIVAPPPANARTQSLQFTTNDPTIARTRPGGPSTASRDSNWGDLTARPSGSTAAPQNGTTLGAPAPSLVGRGTGAIAGGTNFGQPPQGMSFPNAGQNAPAFGGQNQKATGQASPTYPAPASPYPTAANKGQPEPNPFANRPAQPQIQPKSSPSPPNYPPGTWFVDASGRPVNKEGQLLDSRGWPIDAAGNRIAQTDSRQPAPVPSYPPPRREPISSSNVASKAGQPAQAGPLTGLPPIRAAADDRQLVTRSAPAGPIAGNPDFRSQSGQQGSSQRGNDQQGSDSRGGVPGTAARSLAAQPLFNGLLLISLVVNIYLINWLQKLRNRFRDLVTAKRVANSNPTPS